MKPFFQKLEIQASKALKVYFQYLVVLFFLDFSIFHKFPSVKHFVTLLGKVPYKSNI